MLTYDVNIMVKMFNLLGKYNNSKYVQISYNVKYVNHKLAELQEEMDKFIVFTSYLRKHILGIKILGKKKKLC